jgi:hypothetical protein
VLLDSLAIFSSRTTAWVATTGAKTDSHGNAANGPGGGYNTIINRRDPIGDSRTMQRTVWGVSAAAINGGKYGHAQTLTERPGIDALILRRSTGP